MTQEQIVWRHIKQHGLIDFTVAELYDGLSAAGVTLTPMQVTSVVGKFKLDGKVMSVRKESLQGKGGCRTRYAVIAFRGVHNMPMLPGKGRAA